MPDLLADYASIVLKGQMQLYEYAVFARSITCELYGGTPVGVRDRGRTVPR